MKNLIDKNEVPKAEFGNEKFQLNYSPIFDKEREFYKKTFKKFREYYIGKDVLEIGYPWGGREVKGSKVMDLYDPRPDINYKTDACYMEGVPDESFDYIICNSILEHVPTFWLIPQQIKRVLRKGGVVLCSVPSVWPYHPSGGGVNYGGDYWRMNHESMRFLFNFTEELACFYIPPDPRAGDHIMSGWGIVYWGAKK